MKKKFSYCIIGNKWIEVHTKDINPCLQPAFSILVIDGYITVEGNTIIVEGGQYKYHIYFNREYVKNLDYEPHPKCVKHTLFRKKSYVKGWVQEYNPVPFKRVLINYTVTILD